MNKKGFLLWLISPLSLLLTAQQPGAWSLEQCIQHALEHNIQIQQKALQTEQAEVQLHTAKWSRLPNLNAGMDQSWNFGRSNQTQSGLYEDQQISNTSLGLSSSIPLFTGFRIPNEIKQKKLDLQAAVYGLEKAKEDLSLSITSLYLQVLFSMELCKVSENQIELVSEQVLKTEELVAAGKVPTSQLFDIKAQAASLASEHTQNTNQLQLYLLDLAQTLELPSVEGFSIQEPLWANEVRLTDNGLLQPEQLYAKAVQQRPGIKEQTLLLESSQTAIKIAKASLYPSLDLGLRYNNSYFYKYSDSNKSFSEQIKNNAGQAIAFSLNIPIFNRFQVKNQIRLARLQRANQHLNLENEQKVLYKDIQIAYYNAIASLKKFQAAKATEEAAQAAFGFTQERYTLGKITVFELNEAQSKLIKSSAERIQAKYEYILRTKIVDFYSGTPLHL